MTPQPQTNLYKLYIAPKDNWFPVVHPSLRAWTSMDLYSALSCCENGWLFHEEDEQVYDFLCSFGSLSHLQSLMPELFI